MFMTRRQGMCYYYGNEYMTETIIYASGVLDFMREYYYTTVSGNRNRFGGS